MAQSLSLNLGANGNGSLASSLVSIVAITSVLAIAPGILVMGTSFTRLVVVLSMLRHCSRPAADAAKFCGHRPRAVPHRLHHGSGIRDAYREGVQPLINGAFAEEQAFDRGTQPFRNFMTANTARRTSCCSGTSQA